MNTETLKEIGRILAEGYPSPNKELVAQEITSILEMVLPALANRASLSLNKGKNTVEEVWPSIREESEDLFIPALGKIERAKVIYVASKFQNNQQIGTLVTEQAMKLAKARR